MRARLGSVVVAAIAAGSFAWVGACSGSSGGGTSTADGGGADSTGSSSGTSSSGGDSGGSTSSSGGDSGGSTSSSGAGDSGGSTSSGGDSGGSSSGAYVGGIGAAITKIGGSPTYELSGGFFAKPDAGTSGACAGTASGSCCYLPPGTSSGGGTGLLVSAGTITVKNAGTTISTMTPGTGGAYDDTSSKDPTVIWKLGDTLAVTGSGDVVHPFTGTIVTVVDIAGVTPAIGPGAPVSISTSADFVVTWTPGPGASDMMTLTLAAVKATQADGSLSCLVKDSAGTLTVTKDLLSMFGSTDVGTIGLQRTSSDTVTIDNALIELTSNTVVNGSAKFAK